MSTQHTISITGESPSHTSLGRWVRGRDIAGLSMTGVMLFLIGVFVIGSGFMSLRPAIGELRLHPYLIPVAAIFPFMLLTRLHLFPVKILAGLFVFVGMYFVSVCNGTDIALNEVFKLGSAAVTIITCALLVRKRGDFVAGVVGLSLASAALAYNGLLVDASAGVEAIEGANKNSYSLFALPALLLGGYVFLAMPSVPIAIRSIPVVCAVPSLAAIFMSGNRSGYLGAVIVAGMLFWNRKGKGLLLVGAIALIVAGGILKFGSTKVFDERMQQTVKGNESDEYRKAILWACLDIGLENPLVGVSPQKLPMEIGRRTSVKFHFNMIESHNVFAHIFAGSGMLCTLAIFAFGYTMWSWHPKDRRIMGKSDPAYDVRRLLRMWVVLWCARGVFTRDILYNPSFNISLGLIIGLCIITELAHPAETVDAGQGGGAPPRQRLRVATN
jgi:hypothetical protein